mmetsp:Transcript_22203/g.57910  ORF Transcript_22203/g.57910 Transcript_22203/m.57910 type:complete len:211 (-) Transcript_22203:147-779(-)
MSASLARSRFRASRLFAAWVRSRVDLTATPVGRCTMRTAVSTLLTFWPPAPPARAVVISRSLSSKSTMSCGNAGWSSGNSGIGSTLANDVWRFAALLKGDCRTSRCAPRSPRNKPNACGPSTWSVTLFTQPGWSPSARSSSRHRRPRASQKRAYMRATMAVQSWASRPPAPACTSKRHAHASKGPFSACASCLSSRAFRSASSASVAASA